MSIQRVDMWRVTCNGCGQDNGGDYWAWAQKEHAESEWEDSDGFVLPDGRTYCADCELPPEFCRFGYRGEFKHSPDDENPGVCVECEKPIPAAVTP